MFSIDILFLIFTKKRNKTQQFLKAPKTILILCSFFVINHPRNIDAKAQLHTQLKMMRRMRK